MSTFLLKQNEMDVVFQAKCESLENACDGVDSVGLAPLEDLSEKVKVWFFSMFLLTKYSC
jgi:hypothetical protein